MAQLGYILDLVAQTVAIRLEVSSLVIQMEGSFKKYIW